MLVNNFRCYVNIHLGIRKSIHNFFIDKYCAQLSEKTLFWLKPTLSSRTPCIFYEKEFFCGNYAKKRKNFFWVDLLGFVPMILVLEQTRSKKLQITAIFYFYKVSTMSNCIQYSEMGHTHPCTIINYSLKCPH